eukprot:CAMPEP_0185773084 /NCGR_PEP_ID=MMETSP1174-20130828/72279_1 /TAXON_ID=35687 /ORGANISM="Dictyocha speculum, Strain CCMP1381" /LENGTH=148 /DNA_ID=CAMNT_0028459629 /DNA_START=176 /DNA_END=619 /DNA_ORIENTATION=+
MDSSSAVGEHWAGPGHIEDNMQSPLDLPNDFYSDDIIRADGPGHVSGLLNPKAIHALMARTGADDPILHDFFSDFVEFGPMKAMGHLGRPVITRRLVLLMGGFVYDDGKNNQDAAVVEEFQNVAQLLRGNLERSQHDLGSVIQNASAW